FASVLAQSALIEGLVLEASGRYGVPVAHYLSQKGYFVSYLNPKLSKGFATRGLRYSKNDAQDAKILADYVRQERPPLWQAPSEAQRQLQQRSRRLETLKKMRQQEVNRLKTGLDDAFVCEQIRGSIAYFEQLIHETE